MFPPPKEWGHVRHGRRVDKCMHVVTSVRPSQRGLLFRMGHVSWGRRVDKCMHVVTNVCPSQRGLLSRMGTCEPGQKS